MPKRRKQPQPGGKILRINTQKLVWLMNKQGKSKSWWSHNTNYITRKGIDYLLTHRTGNLRTISLVAYELGVSPLELLEEVEYVSR